MPVSYELSDDEAFSEWFESAFSKTPKPGDPRVAELHWAFSAGQLHELRREREYHRFERMKRQSSLTIKEREISRLAAAGLTNRQIAKELGISELVVSNSLYTAFPKLGITSRYELRDAFARLGIPLSDEEDAP